MGRLAPAAVAVGIDTVLFSSVSGDSAPEWVFVPSPAPLLTVALCVVMLPVLAFRARAPLVVSLGLAAYAAALTVYTGSRPLVSLLLALYVAASSVSAAAALVCLVATLAAHSLTVAFEVGTVGAERPVFVTFAVGLAFTLLDGSAWALGRRAARAQQRERQLITDRQEQVSTALAAERMRIARELHDVVASAVTAMVVHAGVAERTTHSQPNRARDSLRLIQGAGVRATAELRHLLTLLREADAEFDELRVETDVDASMFEAVFEQARSTGILVDAEEYGQPRALDPIVRLAAFRVVQEAVTNIIRHAGAGTRATIRLTWGDALSIVICDDGRGRPAEAHSASSGFGLIGLHERVRLVGGTLRIGRPTTGGFKLEALLPIRLDLPQQDDYLLPAVRAPEG